ncbi:MAG: DUF3320 domain-containing protein [Planctomycetota bacterium]|jgi:very-short-patch-repair endonuclease
MTDPTRERLDHWKAKLIALSRRNRLIHYRPARVTSVRVVDELPAEVFRTTALERRTMTFAPKAQEQDASTEVHRPHRPEEAAGRHTDRSLQTDLEKDRLAKNLLQIYRKAASVQEEHGYNTLFLALGFLEWRESEAAEDVSRSPILLVPVELARRSVASPFRLKATEDDPLVNPALLRLLEQQFRITAPALPDHLDDFDPVAFLDEFAKAAAALPVARVTTAIHLGLFSFTKFMMYKDLDVHRSLFETNPLVRALSGDREAIEELPRDPVPEGEQLDAIPLDECYHVVDADSSQQEVVEAAKRGRSLIVEGPPGTGKSQTITNVIAECLMAGKRVLFVSEKMAALRVVFDRLSREGLGDFCLELHGHKGNRRHVIRQLGETLELARERPRIAQEILQRASKLRDELNAYVRELRTPVEPLGIPPFRAFGILASHEQTPEVPVFLKGAGAWSKERCEGNLGKVGTLARLRARVAPTTSHPWRGCWLTDAPYDRQIAIRKALDDVLDRHAELDRKCSDLAGKLQTRKPETFDQVRALADLAAHLARSPKPERAVLEDARWDGPDPAITETVRNGKTYSSCREELLRRWDEAILDTAVEPISHWWARHGSSLLRLARPTFWKFRGVLKKLRKNGGAQTGKDLLLAVKARRARKKLAGADGTPFGSLWKELESPWDTLEGLALWMAGFRRHVRSGLVTEHCLQLAESGLEKPDLPDPVPLESAWKALASLVEWRGEIPGPDEMRDRAAGMKEAMPRLEEWTRYRVALKEIAEPDTVAFARKLKDLEPDQFEPAFERQFHRSWVEEILPDRPHLAKFDGRDHGHLVAAFRELDRRVIGVNRSRARAKLLERLPDPSWDTTKGSDLDVLLREVRKKRRHIPLRKLFEIAHRSIARVKPCFMMSPLSVAQYLVPDAEPFDVVVFDEASQIAPQDATDDYETAKSDLENILDECATIAIDRRMLRWHYRSRHEELIAFSNRTYYHDRLYTFPNPGEGEGEMGVEFVFVEDGVYDRGKSGKNVAEAERVAADVIAHLKAHPDMSVGVGAFSQKQQQAIEDALERIRRESPDSEIEMLFDRATDGYCFVKNLETIQGDERDVIFISIGYGKDPAGKMSMNFGPLNQLGGERRLNVLVTRARRKVRVYSSIQPGDIDLSRTKADGVHNLRKYLEYAKHGPEVLLAAGADGGEEDALFEDAVHDALSAEGLRLDRQVGCSGYRIDFAVKDDGRYLLGIECDGATYHFAPTARDRDRLRHQVLRSLGWRLHRIWSADWFRDPAREVQRVLEAIERARAGTPEETPVFEFDASGATRVKTKARPAEIRPYPVLPVTRLGGQKDFLHAGIEGAAEVLARVVAHEGPIHFEEAARRVVEHWRISRVGQRIADTVKLGARRCERNGTVLRRGDFLWPADMEKPPVRRRESKDAPREVELIAPEEIAEAILLVLKKEFRVRQEDLVDRAARVLGFSRTGTRVREHVEDAVDLLRSQDRITGDETIELKAAPRGVVEGSA